MEAEDIFDALIHAAPFLIIAAAFYAIAAWKKRKGKALSDQAQQLILKGDDEGARTILFQALWTANQEPILERQILNELGDLHQRTGVDFRVDDYNVLVQQFEQLSKKSSHKAISEMKKVQILKKELIGRMSEAA